MTSNTFFSLMLIICLIIGVVIGIGTRSKGYKCGQIHALTGRVKYHLVVKPDSTRIWVKIKEADNGED